MRNWVWLCPPLMLIAAAALMMSWGYSFWMSVLFALLIVCPVIILYGVVKVMRASKDFPLEGVLPKTKGMPLNWAAPFYDFYCPKIGLGKAFREATLKLAGIKKGEKVLDVGCGTGILTMLAADEAGEEGAAVGIDPAQYMIVMARKNASERKSRAEFRLAVIEDLPFKDNSFDCVLSSLMIHHLPPDVKLKGFAEVRRVLKPGGRFVAVDIDRPAKPLWWLIAWPLLFWSFTKEQIRRGLDRFFKEAGFLKLERAGRWMGILSFWKAYK